MEKPTGVILKIIESLQQVNALDVYSPIEKDIILHNLRAAYMIFLNVSANEQSVENRVAVIEFEGVEEEVEEEVEEVEEVKELEEEVEEEVSEVEEVKELEEEVEEEVEEVEEVKELEEEVEEEVEEVEEVKELEEEVEEEVEEVEEVREVKELEEEIEKEMIIEEPISEPLFFEAPLVADEPLVDDILEFIPDAKPQSGLLFDDMSFSKPEKRSLNDLLTEKKEDQTLGTRFQQTYIPDLTKAIAINEKFTFIRELFHNSGVDFSNAVQKLNECENIDAAFVLMEELKHQYLWDTTSTSYLSLCDLVRRRFL